MKLYVCWTDVPVLVSDSGEVVADSNNVIAWAKEHPAR